MEEKWVLEEVRRGPTVGFRDGIEVVRDAPEIVNMWLGLNSGIGTAPLEPQKIQGFERLVCQILPQVRRIQTKAVRTVQGKS